MRRRLMTWARPVAGAVALLLVLAVVTPPAQAAEARSKNSAKAPLATSIANKVAALKPAPRAFQTPTGGPDSRSFLRTPVGMVAVVVMAAGLGFATYSAFKDNDAVHSPIR